MATTYVVLLPGDESVWDNATAEERAAAYAKHEEFARLLAERGHTITGGAELTPSRTGKHLRPDDDGSVAVHDGPYAETVEQLGGLYLVESDDLDDLLEICRVLVGAESAVEVRAAVDHEDGTAP